MAKFILFLDRLIYFYIYFVIGACLLSWVPNINPDYPLFAYIFKAAGFYLIPPILGFSFSPTVVVLALVIISVGLRKLYDKFFAKKEPEIIILTKDELINKLNKDIKEVEDKDDSI